MISSLYKNEKAHILFLYLLFVLIQLTYFFQKGVQTSVDTSFYIENAQALLKFELLENRAFGYLSFVIVTAIHLLFDESAKSIVITNIIAHAFASYCIYTTIKTFKNSTYALAGTVLYLLWFELSQWNFYVYTDALFSHFTTITACFFLTKQKKKLLWILPFTILLRPPGIILMALLCLYIINHSSINKWIVLSISACFGVFILNIYIPYFIGDITSGTIVYPDMNLGIVPPSLETTPSSPFSQLLEVILQHPLYLLKITIFKISLFISHCKPYYSIYHNIFNLVYLLPLYTVLTIKFKESNKWFVGFILLSSLMIGISTENYDGRFLHPCIGILILAVFTLKSIGNKKALA